MGRRAFAAEFKREAVKAALQPGVSKAQVLPDNAAGTGTNTFTWTANVATAGTYEVYARWTAYPNRATNAKYTITHSGGSDLVTVNQQANTATWQLLGTYT